MFGLQIPVPPSAQPSRQELVRITIIIVLTTFTNEEACILYGEFTCACKFSRGPIFIGTIVSRASTHSRHVYVYHITFQARATVAASIPTYGILTLGKCPCGLTSRVMFSAYPGYYSNDKHDNGHDHVRW